MNNLARIYQPINLLSLDVAAGAVVSALFFARVFGVTVLPWAFGSLGLTVWIIYTADHLLDAKRAVIPASSHRHRFHQKHFRVLVIGMVVACLVNIVLLFFIRKPVLQAGFALSGVVGIYILLQRNLKFVKELSGGLLYCAGVLLPAWSLSSISIDISQMLLVIQFTILVLSNLLIFSLFDVRGDLRDHHQSFVTALGEDVTRTVLYFLFVLSVILIVAGFFYSGATRPGVALLVMNVILFVIFVLPKRFETGDLYRLIGDAIFLVPLFFFWV